MVMKIANLLSVVLVFFAYMRPIMAWALNSVKDEEISLDEVQAGAAEFWPKKDQDGQPLPIPMPWKRRK